VTLAEITVAFLEDLAHCAPHGAGNPAPLFCAQAVHLVAPIRWLGQEGKHARFRVAQEQVTLEVVAFNQRATVSALAPGTVLDIAFSPVLNTWRQQQTVELHLRAIRPHRPLTTLEKC
jgi:single-stranded-DNA-specific exonuclease